MRNNKIRDLNELAVFTYVVEQGGFTAAAKAARLPKSSISRQIASLEKRLGVRLLERTTRKVHVTEIGHIYYRHCRRMLEEADHADLYVEQTMEIPRGILRVSASVTTGQHLLAPLVAEFITQYPEVQFELVWTNRQVDVIDEGFDLVVRIGPLQDSSLVARSLGHYRLCLYASVEYLNARGRPQKPEDLQDHDCLVMSDMGGGHQWTFSMGDITKYVGVTPRASVNDFNSLRRMVADGSGIAILPSYLHADDYHDRLVSVLDDWTGCLIELHALFPSHRGATPKVRAFLDFLVVRLGGLKGG
ncbi:MAG TPA: LysR family transcriptional regulator [Gammaproteobacteria bacterium]|nr:LysR family transcriptional regulator [Gammaproteobacteria bacterium]